MVTQKTLRAAALLLAAAGTILGAAGVILGYPKSLFAGLLVLVTAFLTALLRFYLAKVPIPVRGGAKLTLESDPLFYRVWFALAAGFAIFVSYVLLRALVSAG